MSKAPHLRAVQGDPAPDAWFAAQAQALLTRALTENPTAMVILWESASTISHGAVPASDALFLGMVRTIAEAMEGADEE
jgi:hypothetical protein